jgi:hypothetical protein
MSELEVTAKTNLERKLLVEGLGLGVDRKCPMVFRDWISGNAIRRANRLVEKMSEEADLGGE